MVSPDPEAEDIRDKEMWPIMKLRAQKHTFGSTYKYNKELALLIPSCGDMIKAWIKN